MSTTTPDDDNSPPVDVDYEAVRDSEDPLGELAKRCLDLPRSKRVQVLFDWEPTEYQAELLDWLEAQEMAEAAPQKGRQVGATMTAGTIGADHALMAPVWIGEATDVLYAAPAQETADEMFEECKDRFEDGPLTLDQYGVETDNEQTWTFDTGARIMSRTLGNVEQEDQPGQRGKNPTCVVIDEAAYEKDKVYTEAIEQFFLTHDTYEYVLFSTPAGKSGYYYKKVEHDDDWFSPHWPSPISPYISEEKIEERREKLPADVFAQEIMGEFAEDGGSAIDHGVWVANVRPDVEPEPGRPRHIGIDPARAGNDECVLLDMDAAGVAHNAWSFATIDGPRFVELLEILQHGKRELEYWDGVPEPAFGAGVTPEGGYETIIVEENGVGGFAADFAEANLGDVIHVVTSTNKRKQAIYQRFITDLEAEEFAFPKHRQLQRQATTLQKSFTPTGKAKYEAPPGKHDDWPDAAAFANWARHGNGEPLDTSTREVTRRRSGRDSPGRRTIRR